MRKFASTAASTSHSCFSMRVPIWRLAFCSRGGFVFFLLLSFFFFSTFCNQQIKVIKDTEGSESVLPMELVDTCIPVLNAPWVNTQYLPCTGPVCAQVNVCLWTLGY